jgi:hypothetical protein
VLWQQVIGEIGELLLFGRRPSLARTAETGEALAGVRIERHLAHLAIADDVDAGVHLLRNAIADRLTDSFGKDCAVLVSSAHQLEQVRRPGQAARVCGEDAFGAALHSAMHRKGDGLFEGQRSATLN